ncbi:MAG: ComF family protein [Chloroflexi bacterium]|nr:ComF family protein [Chloroflexota bacterium]
MASPSSMRGVALLQQRGRQVWGSFIDLLYPPQCGGCQTAGSLWCDACRAAIEPIKPPWCEKCGEPFVTDRLCANCRTHPLQIEKIRSVALFEGVLRQAIHRFKDERLAGLAEPFGEMLADYWRGELLTADWLIPVPLHPSRERDRGYNQSELLTRSLARRVNVPVSSKGLRRTRATAVQMTLNAAQRRENVAGAFECIEARVRGARVMLIDDVGTTGATLDACAQAVLKAGAASVMGLTLARTP